MCGICGELDFTGKAVDPSSVKRMADAIIHRGPDDFGIYCSGPVGLGHRRLSILDLSAAGKQPMASEDGALCIVYNGEIYNYREIKQDLRARGYSFRNSTDTEVVLYAIHCWGLEEALSKFVGMFAFALWDDRKKLLHLCRDRAGIKPLYYHVGPGRLLFGSEIKALLAHPEFKRELNQTALGQFFINGYLLDNLTVFKNTFKLTPGHYLTLSQKGDFQLHKYWGLEDTKRGSFRGTYDDAAAQLEHLMDEAFSQRLVADVPVGLFLSGGIDSTLVSAIIRNKTNADLLNITIGFTEKQYNEAPKAERVSRELGVRHIVHYINPLEAQETLSKFCEIYDEPFGDTSGIPTYILSKLARQHVKVALSADGGDEQFCGYENYASYLRDFQVIMKFPLALRMALSRFLGMAIPYRKMLSWKSGVSNEMTWTPQSIARYEKMLRLLEVSDQKGIVRLMNEKAWSEGAVSGLIPGAVGDLFKGTPLSAEVLENFKGNLLDEMMRTDYSTFLRDDILVKVDRASMAVSLECRDPFLDHRIAEFAFSLPMEYLFHHGEHKRILKKILRKWVSEEVISSPKRGFMIPLYYWLRGAWKPMVMEYLSESRVRAVGVLDVKTVQREVEQFYRYHGCRAEKIWMMLNFQMWAERWYLRA